MNLSHPGYDLLGENATRVLGRLAVLAEGASGRRIHELSGVANLRTTQGILERLVIVGLIDVRAVGSANLYTLNRDHALWRPVRILLEMPAALEGKLMRLIPAKFGDHVEHAVLYGSFARGEASDLSDIDILLVWRDDGVSPDDRASMVERAATWVRARTGNNAQFLGVTRAEWNALVAVDDPLVASVQAEGRALTAGTDVAHLGEG